VGKELNLVVHEASTGLHGLNKDIIFFSMHCCPFGLRSAVCVCVCLCVCVCVRERERERVRARHM
jgi:hypothetical protein